MGVTVRVSLRLCGRGQGHTQLTGQLRDLQAASCLALEESENRIKIGELFGVGAGLYKRDFSWGFRLYV
jgi:hypothetical protein